MMTLMLVVRENDIAVVITHSASFHNVPIGETLYVLGMSKIDNIP